MLSHETECMKTEMLNANFLKIWSKPVLHLDGNLDTEKLQFLMLEKIEFIDFEKLHDTAFDGL